MGKKNKNNRNNNNKGNANKPVNSAPKAEEEVKAEEVAKVEVEAKAEETEKVEEIEKAEVEVKAEAEEAEKAEVEVEAKVEETEKTEVDVKAKTEETEKVEVEAKTEEAEKVEETEKAEAEEEVKAVKKEPVKRKIGRGVGITLIVVGALIIIIPCAILLSDLYTRKQAQKSLEKFQAAMTAAANESLASSASEAESAEAVSDKADPVPAADTETKADASVSEQEDTTATGQAELNPSDGTSEGLEPEEGDLSLTEGDDAADASDESEPLEDEEPYIPEEEEEEEDEDPENIEINEAGVAFNNELFSSHRLVGQECIGSLYIEAIDLVYAIVEGVSDHEIGYAIGHFPDSVGIGKNGNCALAGHNGGTYGRYFGEIDELDFGDTIVMTDLYGRQTTYEVCSKFTCNPDQYSLVVGDVGKKGKFLTMMTCCENGTKRYVVRAKAIKK